MIRQNINFLYLENTEKERVLIRLYLCVFRYEIDISHRESFSQSESDENFKLILN